MTSSTIMLTSESLSGAFLAVAGIIGVLGAPRNAGKSLEEIQVDRRRAAVERAGGRPAGTSPA